MSTQNDNLDSDSQKNSPPNVRPYQQEQRLRDLYTEQDFTQQEIADKFGVSVATICRWLGTHDITKDRRSINKWTLPDGYVQYSQGSDFLLYQHNLVALEDLPVHVVFDDSLECHHQLGSPVKLDVAANVDIVDDEQHNRRHIEGTATVDPEKMLPYICGEYANDENALSWNFSDGAPDHCLNSDDDQDGGS